MRKALAAAITAVGIGVSAGETGAEAMGTVPTSGVDLSRIDDETFEERFSECSDDTDFAGPTVLLRVERWFTVDGLGEITGREGRTDLVESTTRDVVDDSVGDPQEQTLAIHESLLPGLAAGLSTPTATVFVGTTPNDMGQYVVVALVTLDDGRVLAPGYCMSDSLYGRDAFDPESRMERAALLISMIGATPTTLEDILKSGS